MPMSPEAFASLYRAYAPELERRLCAAGLDPDTALDGVNDAFASAFAARDDYAGTTSGDAREWLLRHVRVQLVREPPLMHVSLPELAKFELVASDVLEDRAATEAMRAVETGDLHILERLVRVKPDRLVETIAELVEASGELGLELEGTIDPRALSRLRDADFERLTDYLREDLEHAYTWGNGGFGSVLRHLNELLLLPPLSAPTLLGPDGQPLAEPQERALEVSIAQINAELLTRLTQDPELVHALSPRQFEELLAEILARQGYEVQLTAATRDGGADLHVIDHQALGSFLYLVKCKKHRADRPVGVGVVRQLFGVVQASRANAGIVATTSYFTRDAEATARELKYQISLRDFASLSAWLRGGRAR